MSFGIFTLVGVIMLVMSSASFAYLLQIKNKTRASWMLFWFFLCVILSAITTILTNTGLPWERAFAPSQDAFLLLGGVFLVRFAYHYPAYDQPRETRLVTWFFAIVGLGAMGYALFFAIRFLASLPAMIDEIQAFYLITPLAMVLAIFVFFKRCVHWSRIQIPTTGKEAHPGESVISNILHPRNQPAVALRNFGLALAIGLLPAVVTVSRFAIPDLITNYLFNFGIVAAIAAIMLVYLNYSPETTTITAKLVGFSLVTVLLILGLAGVWFMMQTSQPQVHKTSLAFIYLVLLSSILIIIVYPLFFRSTLLNPLAKLLAGVREANEGNLEIQVEVQYEDEIGYLTHSFNRMLSSLNEAAQLLRDESILLEKQVAERTAELQKTNQQLTRENRERKNAEARLDQQLHYEHALASCSQSLLQEAEDEGQQQQVLTQALEHLRAGASASRAYVFRNIPDNDLGLCMGILAEACAQDIAPHINNSGNKKYPWSRLPKAWFSALESGNAYGGPVESVFISTPKLLENFLSQPEPLLSIQTFPIFFNNQWWGFVGFDECETRREWEKGEVLMLRTASEMIGNTIQRWQAEDSLRETLGHLEQRVLERTIEFAQVNAELRHEIHERQHFQSQLEDRLEIERTLAEISTRLLSPMQLKDAIQETLADLGKILQASRVVFQAIPYSSNHMISEMIEWRSPGAPPLPNNWEQHLNKSYSLFQTQLNQNKAVTIQNPTFPEEALEEREILKQIGVDSLILLPLFVEKRLRGVIACTNLSQPMPIIAKRIQSGEVVAGMLGSMLQRDSLLNMLEEKVAERTRELSAFFDLAVLAGEAQELSDIMQPALVRVMEISASEAAVIHVVDEEQRVMRIVAQRGFQSKYLSQLQTIHLDESTMAWIIDRSDDVWSSGTSKHPDAFELPQFQSDTHIPLRARGKIQGLLSCYRISQTPFNPYQVFFLNAIGEQLGLAVENHRLRLKTEEIATLQERQRLARELHDAVSQSLYSLTLFARSGRDAFESGNQAKLLDSLEQLETNSLAALKEMRLLLYQLRSLVLEKGGLVLAIESRFNLVERRSGTQAAITMGESVQLPDRVEQELFLLITEALNNSLKHAGASQVSVSIAPENEHIVMVVWNNGSSFDPAVAQAGMGLENMRQRATVLGGQLSITSQPGSGTSIRVEIPKPTLPARES